MFAKYLISFASFNFLKVRMHSNVNLLDCWNYIFIKIDKTFEKSAEV